MKIIINPNKEIVDIVRKGLEENNGYCPCALEHNEDTKCPCKIFRETKDCHCGLYVTAE